MDVAASEELSSLLALRIDATLHVRLLLALLWKTILMMTEAVGRAGSCSRREEVGGVAVASGCHGDGLGCLHGRNPSAFTIDHGRSNVFNRG